MVRGFRSFNHSRLCKWIFLRQGLGNSNEKLFYLPEAYNDFIFSVVGEELGFIGVLITALMFISFIFIGFKMAISLKSRVGSIMVSTIVFTIGFQAFLNMGVVLGVLPTKGLNLPFISYGGSSMVANLVALGLIFACVKIQPGDAKQIKCQREAIDIKGFQKCVRLIMKYAVLVAGGTGGHINAALAVGEALEAEGFDIRYLTGKRHLDYQLFKNKPVKHLNSRPLRTNNPFTLLKNILLNILSFISIFSLYLKKRPDFVVGAGGYVCGPTLLAGYLLFIPVFIIEQNAVMGLTNRLLGWFSRRIFVHFSRTLGLPPKLKIKSA